MTVNSINSNVAAYYAQLNIGNNSNNVAASVSRLSSGNRIVKSSDDVAGLSIGTSLRTNVATLKVAKLNGSLGSSLLQVADGALAQIGEILQRQKAIATQAGSGSLGATERGYLDQEFQALTLEVDRLAGSTNFNGVTLLDGALAGNKAVTSNTADGAAASLSTAAAIVTVTTAVPTAGDTVTINGVTVTFTASTPGQAAAVGKVTIGTTIAATAANLAAFLNASGKPQFANLEFTASGAAVSANYTGGVLGGTANITFSTSNSTNLVGAATTIAAGGTNGLGLDRFSYAGTVGGSLLITGSSGTTDFGTPIDLSLLKNNADFIGSLGTGNLGNIQGTYANATDTATFSIKVGKFTYTTTAADITQATPLTLTFTGADNVTGAAAGGSFKLFLRGNGITASSITSQQTLDPITAQLNDSLAAVSFYQNRDVTSFQNGDSVLVGGVQVANLTGASVDFHSNDFSNTNISSIKITAPGIGNTDAVIEMVINGETYTSVAGIGNQIGKNVIVGLQNVNDPTKILSLVTGNAGIADAAAVTLDLSTQAKADAVASALSSAFGLSDTTAALTFQIGTQASDTLGVKIDSVTTHSLFGGQALDVLTQTSAATAGDAVDTAIRSVTAVRANVGALESRFNFAAANIDSTIQNQDAARGELLDTDIASESTSFAISQVKLQAGISTLAQANQELQSLLKLIG